jgi:hypothetical protein
MLTAGTIVRRKQDCNHRPGQSAEIVEVLEAEEAFTLGGIIYIVRLLEGISEGVIDNWNSNYFDVEQHKEPDWEV